MKKLLFFLACFVPLLGMAGIDTNILKNPGAESSFTDWSRTDGNPTYGWTITGGYDGVNAWLSSYDRLGAHNTLSQTVDLATEGYKSDNLDLSMPIYASMYIAGNGRDGSAYVKVELLNASNSVLRTYYVCNKNFGAGAAWEKFDTIITGYPIGLRKIRYTFGGGETAFYPWAGWYGPKFDEAELKMLRVYTKDASSISYSSATLNSSVYTTSQSSVEITTLPSTVKFEYGTTSGSYPNSIDVPEISGTDANVNLTGLAQGTTYFARVVMTNSEGTFYGNEISFRTKILLTITDPVVDSKMYDGNADATVSALGTLSGIEGADDVSVLPTAVFDNKDAGANKTVTISYELNGVNKGKYVAPVNSVLVTGEITKAPLTITADDQSKVYGESNPVLTYQYSGWVSGVETIDDEPIISTTVNSLTNAGTYTDAITFSGGSDQNYELSLVDGDFEVSKATLTVTADDQSKVYCESNPVLTFQYSGWVNGIETIDDEPVINTTVATLTNAGTYTGAITLSGGSDNNYELDLVAGDFVVSKATLTVTADDQDKVYGENNPVLTYQYSGWVNGVETIDAAPSISTTVTNLTNADTYAGAITLSGGSDNNYELNLVAGDFVVSKATLTVTADDQNKAYGENNPELTYQYSGWVNGIEIIDVEPTISTSVTNQTSVGSYIDSITLTGGSDNNYLLELVNADFVVGKAQLDVFAVNDTIIYGEPIPELTISYVGFADGEDADDLILEPEVSLASGDGINAGSYVISLSEGSADNYEISYHDGVFVVKKAALIVAADNKNRLYGKPNPVLTLSYSGFVNGESVDVLDVSPVATLLLTADSNARQYEIGVSGGLDNNYDFIYKNGIMSVEQGNLNIHAENKTMRYGDSIPELTIRYEFFDTVGTVSGLDHKITAWVDSITGPGTYPIHISGGKDDNYVLFYFEGQLTVEKALLKVTAHDKSITYGEQLPELTYTIEGFLKGDKDSVLSSLPTIVAETGAGENAGTYAIIPSGGFDEIYDFDYQNGTLNVAKAMLTATATDMVSSVGTIPSLTIGYMGFVNGDTFSELDTLPLATTTATKESPSGSYQISVSGGYDNNYNFTYIGGELTLASKASPTITWNTPSDIVCGELLCEKQLNATCNASGVMIYEPAAGTQLGVGEMQELKVTFIPFDTVNINKVSAIVHIDVAKTILTVTANNKTITYGETLPVLSFSYSSFMNGENASVLDKRPTASTMDGVTDAGTYPIVLFGGEDDNYNFEYVNGELTIEKAKITVDVNDCEMFEGDALPVFALNYSGFVAGESVEMLDTLPIVTTQVTPASTPGVYEVIVSGGSDNNYSFVYGKGTLTVKAKQRPVVTWANPSDIAYGTALGTTQLNATTNVGGTFSYTPSTGTVLEAGKSQLLIVRFAPTDIETYAVVTDTVLINVGKAPLTVTADNKEMKAGEAMPEFTMSYGGFVNGDDKSDIDKLPVATSTAKSANEKGIYEITVSGGEDNNYSFVYVSGVLTIKGGESVDAQKLVSLMVYPNPFTDKVSISSEYNGNGSYQLTDLTGKVICNGLFEGGDTDITLSHIRKGVYLLQVKMGEGSKTFRLVKE